MTRDKAQMDARLKDTQSALIEEEDKGKALTKQKVKLETMLQELEDKLQKEEKVRIQQLLFVNQLILKPCFCRESSLSWF